MAESLILDSSTKRIILFDSNISVDVGVNSAISRWIISIARKFVGTSKNWGVGRNR
jgi:hypothetical protein